MKVLEIGTLDVKAGGPPFSMSRQMYGLQENGIDCVCLMSPCKEEEIIDQRLNYKFTEPIASRLIGLEYIPKINDTFDSIGNVDIIHTHGVWTYITHSACSYARKNNIPCVIAPRGSFYHRAISGKKSFKKRIAWYLYQKNDLANASCIQATCYEEMEEIRALGCKAPIAIIPNSYDVNLVKRNTFRKDDFFRIGYVGRLHPRKHVEKLIYALAEIRKKFKDVLLVVIGSDDQRYEDFLVRECLRLGVTDAVTFTGFLRGSEFDEWIEKCDVFAFPSDFENWGNVVPDVLVREVPAITTKTMPWSVLNDERCGWWVDSDQESINNTLLQAYKMDSDELRTMGNRGRKLIEDRFSVGKIGAMLKELYIWILDGGNKPDFVYM